MDDPKKPYSMLHSEKDRKRHPMRDRWFTVDDPKRALQEANGALSLWQSSQIQRIWDYSRYAKFYGTARLGFSGTIFTRTIHTRDDVTNPLACTFNGIASTVDTVASKIAQHKIVPLPLPSNGDWKSHQRAKQQHRFIKGIFEEQGVYKKGRIAFRDSGVWGDGVVKVGSRFGKITVDRVFPGDLFFNDSESLSNSGMPTECGYIQVMDRRTALEQWGHLPGAAEAIECAPEFKIMVDTAAADRSDLIQINELWRFNTNKKANNGRHIVTTGLDVILLEDYKRDKPPFVFMSYSPRMYGYWSQSVTERLKNLQLQYNDLSYAINEAIAIGGYFKLYLNSVGNHIVAEQITDEIGQILVGEGQLQSLLWQLVQPEIYARLEKLESQFFRELGVSEMNATSMAPSGQESGLARRIQNDIYSERFSLWIESYQEWYCQIAKLIIQELTDIQQNEKDFSYKVYANDGPRADPIDFKDLGFKPEDEFQLSIPPTSDLPETPEGKLAYAGELQASGYYSEQDSRMIAELPDVPRQESMYNSMAGYGSQVLDSLIEDEESPFDRPDVPENTDDVVQLKKMAIEHLAFGKNCRVTETKLDRVRRFITRCNVLIAQATPPTQPQGAMPNAGNPASPSAASPVSPASPAAG